MSNPTGEALNAAQEVKPILCKHCRKPITQNDERVWVHVGMWKTATFGRSCEGTSAEPGEPKSTLRERLRELEELCETRAKEAQTKREAYSCFETWEAVQFCNEKVASELIALLSEFPE